MFRQPWNPSAWVGISRWGSQRQPWNQSTRVRILLGNQSTRVGTLGWGHWGGDPVRSVMDDHVNRSGNSQRCSQRGRAWGTGLSRTGLCGAPNLVAAAVELGEFRSQIESSLANQGTWATLDILTGGCTAEIVETLPARAAIRGFVGAEVHTVLH